MLLKSRPFDVAPVMNEFRQTANRGAVENVAPAATNPPLVPSPSSTPAFAETSPEWLALQRLGFRVHSSRYFLVAWSFSARHDLAWMRRHWYYTLGDTDLA